MTGEFTVKIEDDKQTYKLVAIHPNRTIIWRSDYTSLDLKTHQSSRIELAKNIWLGYDIEVLNHTKVGEHESQEMKFKLSYPTRDVAIGGTYVLKDDFFNTDVTVEWLKKEIEPEQKDNEDENENEEQEKPQSESKTIQGKLQWRDHEAGNKTKDHHSVLLGLKHPSFEKDVSS